MRSATFCDFLQVLLGGGGYFMKSAIKGCFRNVWVGGGRCSHFSALSCTLEVQANIHCTAEFHHIYSESLLSFALPFSGITGTPFGQTSPCMWLSGQKLLLWWGIPFDPKTGLQKRWPQRRCRLLRPTNTGFLAFLPDSSRLTCTHFTPPECALLRTKVSVVHG